MEDILLKFDRIQKRFIAKYLIVATIINKYKGNMVNQRIIPDFNLNQEEVIEVMHQDLGTKKAYLYKVYSDKKELLIEKYEVSFFNSTEMIKVNQNILSDDLEELNKQIQEIVK